MFKIFARAVLDGEKFDSRRARHETMVILHERANFTLYIWRDNSREDFQNEDKGKSGTWPESRKTVEERTLVRSWPRRRGQKTTSTVGKLRFFYGLAGTVRLARASRGYKFMWQLSPGTKCREIRILYIARRSQ